MTSFFQTLGMSYEAAWFTATIAGILLIALPLMLAVALIIYAERKLWAAFALRRGPNVVGPFGVLQSFADGLKVFLQETIIPSASNRGLFLIAPIITFTVALMAWAVIPFADGVVLSNGKIIGKDLIFNRETDFEALLADPAGPFMFAGKPLVVLLKKK